MFLRGNDNLFPWAPKSLWMLTAAMKLKEACSLKENYDKHKHHIKKQRCHFAIRSWYRQSYGSSKTHVWMWELDHKEGQVPKNWCFWIVVLEKTLESPLDCKEIKPVNSKGNNLSTLIGRTDAKAEAAIIWLRHVTSQLTGKDPDAEKSGKQ